MCVYLLVNSWVLVSDFRHGGSRFAFPSFDDPQFKAKFNIIIRHRKNFTALTNMPLKVSALSRFNRFLLRMRYYKMSVIGGAIISNHLIYLSFNTPAIYRDHRSGLTHQIDPIFLEPLTGFSVTATEMPILLGAPFSDLEALTSCLETRCSDIALVLTWLANITNITKQPLDAIKIK